jgi:peptidyl-prolyl cis-trans isomerase SurA
MLFPLPPKAPPTYIQNATKIADMVRSRIASCPQLQKMASAIKGSVFMNLGDMKLSDLSKQMQDALAKTQPGEPTEPFISPAGIEVIARCDKAAPKVTAFVMPTRQQVEQQLFQKQISMLARQYIRDLRREANVETR